MPGSTWRWQAAAAALLTAATTAADPTPLRGAVNFTAHGPAGLKIEGRGSSVSGTSDPATLVFTLELASLQTGIDVRDRHMRDDLQVQAYPTAELRVERSNVRFPPPGGEAKANCPGSLTLHGQTHPVDVSYTARRAAGYDVSGSFQIDLRDYGIAPPTYLGVSVKPDVQIAADVHLDLP